MTAVDVSKTFRKNDPSPITVVSNETVRIRGLNVTVPPATPTVLTKNPKQMLRWYIGKRDVIAAEAAGVLAESADAPTISTVLPATCPNDTSTVVTITGTNFEVSATAKLVTAGGVEVALNSVTRVSSTSITFRVPAAVLAGVYGVRVTDADLIVTKPAALTVTAATITDVSPADAPNDNTTLVTITGTNFYTGVAVHLVSGLGAAIPAGNVTRVGPTSITFTVPAGLAAGTYTVRVTNTGALPVNAVGALDVTSMTITGIDPVTAPNDSTTVVTVTGTNFYVGVAGALIDSLGSVEPMDDFTRVSATSVTFTVPVATTPGTFTVRLANPGAPPVVADDSLEVTAAP